MKYYTFLLLLPLLLLFSNCKKDDDHHQDPVDLLPPATQTGAGTFAALVNGKPFIDESGGWFNCYYQLVDGGYYFSVKGKGNVDMLTSIAVGTLDNEIKEGEVYPITEYQLGNTWAGGVFLLNINNSEIAHTSLEYLGELTITKLDFTNNIVSGTFWFDLKNPYTGERVEIREGRFDTLFTQ